MWTQKRSWKCVVQHLPACLVPQPRKLEGDKPECPLPTADFSFGMCRRLAVPLAHPSNGCKYSWWSPWTCFELLLENLGAQRVLWGRRSL